MKVDMPLDKETKPNKWTGVFSKETVRFVVINECFIFDGLFNAKESPFYKQFYAFK